MHPLKICVTLALLVPLLAIAAPTEWKTIGLRVSAREVMTRQGPHLLPYIVEVQEQGPAYFAGVQPGDALSFFRCGGWSWHYIEQERYGPAMYRWPNPMGLKELSVLIEEVKDRCLPDMGGLITVVKPPDDERHVPEFLEFRAAPTAGGRWLTTKAEIASTIGTARAASSDSFAQLRAGAATELRKAPCSYDVSNAYDLRSMPPIVQEMAAASRAAGGEHDALFWRDVVQVYCSDERNGALPSFETAVYLMSIGTLKPCDYDANNNYTITLDPEKRLRPYSRDEYDRMKDLNYMFGRLLDDTQRACFYKVVRGALGKP